VYPAGYKARGERALSPARGGANSSAAVSADAFAELQGEVVELQNRLQWALDELDETKGEVRMLEGCLRFEMAYRIAIGRKLAKRVSVLEELGGGESGADASSDVGDFEIEVDDSNWMQGENFFDDAYLVWKDEMEAEERAQVREVLDSGHLELGDRAEYRPSSGAEDDDEMEVDVGREKETSGRQSADSESEDEEEDRRVAEAVLARVEARRLAKVKEVEAASRAAEIARAAAEFVAAVPGTSAAEGTPDDEEEWGGIVENEAAEAKNKAELNRERNKRKKERQRANKLVLKKMGRR
jgi:hypothetical protein